MCEHQLMSENIECFAYFKKHDVLISRTDSIRYTDIRLRFP